MGFGKHLLPFTINSHLSRPAQFLEKNGNCKTHISAGGIEGEFGFDYFSVSITSL